MNYPILMGDVVGSSKLDQRQLRKQFKALVRECNREMGRFILSPYTITLGDEFQGIARSLAGLVRSLFFLEETILRKGYQFKLHYVAHHGAIDVPINRAIAYEMMGPGLTRARALLVKGKRGRPRFTFDYGGKGKSELFNDLFFVVEGLIDRWRARDAALIWALLQSSSNADVARRRGKDRSLVWRRRGTLRIEEYVRLKRVILAIAEASDRAPLQPSIPLL